MAQMVESVAVIKLSALVKDGESMAEILSDTKLEQLEEVLEQLVDDPKDLIEVIKD